MHTRILILGAGFGGLELSARLSDELGAEADITLIDRSEGFVFGFSKFELMFGRAELPDVTLYYRDLVRSGVTFRQETILTIDPVARRVTTDEATYEADVLVVALGAEYDFAAVPGFPEGGFEFYSVPGAQRLREVLRSFPGGRVVIGILGQPFKCPPAPCEAAILLDEWLVQHDRREASEITVVSPWGVPIPPSPDGSKAILDKFEERGITFANDRVITRVDPEAKLVHVRDGAAVPYDLFLGVPVHRVPDVVQASGLAVDGWIAVDPVNLATRFPGVYAVGDVTSAPVPKAGVFAESAARAVADHLITQIRGEGTPRPFDGTGSCYVEFGDHQVARLDADFLTGPSPVAPFATASLDIAQEKRDFVTMRRARWFGR
jgi:sulfide:quinone oxidoreductase